ncbi:AT-hook DNA-binding family protein, putative [Medicago truncatula]|uniref:AT-hook motif nuclear-localized protein n=2 Tax=Medicago truncatula TaxID=3880 RepID=G7KG59_MEDTR|nr:AT-hook DNA-binding family protein, putative [Medicago truncatula]
MKGASDTPTDYPAAPRTRIPDFASGPAADSTSQGGIPPMQPVAPAKKKRGRPRKYRPDGSLSLAIPPKPTSSSIGEAAKFELENPGSRMLNYVVVSSSLGNEQSEQMLKTQENEVTPTSTPTAAPPVSTAGQLPASSVSATFTPHIIIVNAGEDVPMKIMSFCQQGPEAICILYVNGVISKVVISRPQSSRTLFTYEVKLHGRYEIRTLSGSFMPKEKCGRRSISGGMSVSLVDLHGHVVGGRVAGPLVAASPVNVVVGSFLPSEHEQKLKTQNNEVISTPAAPMSTAGPNT